MAATQHIESDTILKHIAKPLEVDFLDILHEVGQLELQLFVDVADLEGVFPYKGTRLLANLLGGCSQVETKTGRNTGTSDGGVERVGCNEA